MKGFISKLQKDLNRLQTTLQKEGADLVAKVRKIADKDKIEVKAREIEKLLEAKFKKFEPALESLLEEIKKGAAKAGVDVSKLENSLKTGTSAAKSRISKARAKVAKKSATAKKKKTATKAKPKAAPKKAAATKSST